MSFQELMLQIGEVINRRMVRHDHNDGRHYTPRKFLLVVHEGMLRCVWSRNKSRDDKVVAPVADVTGGLTSDEWEDITRIVRPFYQDYGDSLFGI